MTDSTIQELVDTIRDDLTTMLEDMNFLAEHLTDLLVQLPKFDRRLGTLERDMEGVHSACPQTVRLS